MDRVTVGTLSTLKKTAPAGANGRGGLAERGIQAQDWSRRKTTMQAY